MAAHVLTDDDLEPLRREIAELRALASEKRPEPTRYPCACGESTGGTVTPDGTHHISRGACVTAPAPHPPDLADIEGMLWRLALGPDLRCSVCGVLGPNGEHLPSCRAALILSGVEALAAEMDMLRASFDEARVQEDLSRHLQREAEAREAALRERVEALCAKWGADAYGLPNFGRAEAYRQCIIEARAALARVGEGGDDDK